MKYLKYFENKINLYGKKLTTFKDIAISKHIDGDFDCSRNKLTSLEFGPETVSGRFICYNNELTSLEFCPEYVGGDVFLTSNNLTSLEYHPKFVGGVFYCSGNNWIEPISYELIDKLNICEVKLYTDEQLLKFGSYEYQKEFLNNTPEKYKDLEPIRYNKQIKEEFDWLFNAIDMKLL